MTLSHCSPLRLISLLAVLALPSYAYTIATDFTVDRPTIGDNLFYDIKLGPSDTVTLVDIHLADGSRGNSSLIFGSSDLNKPTDANAGFPIPNVPPGTSYTIRILNSRNKERLGDSATFQIFSPSDSRPTSIGPSTLPSAGPTSTPSQTPSNTPTDGNAQTAPKKSTPIGAIIGGVLGGLAFIVLVLLTLLLMGRRKNRKKRASFYESNNKPRPITPPPLGEVKPFTASPTEPSVRPSNESASHLTTITSATGNRTTISEKARLASQAARSRTTRDTINDSISSPAASSVRADELRVERDRLNRMIADLENRTVSAPSTMGGMSTYTYGSSSNHSGHSSQLAEQVAALRDQIQRMEARQDQTQQGQSATVSPMPSRHFSSTTSNAGYTDYDAPPVYEPPPAPVAAVSTGVVPTPETSQPRPLDLDRKTPL